MIDLSIINEPDFMACVFYFLSFGLLAWFMGWGVSFITSLFIKIINKA